MKNLCLRFFLKMLTLSFFMLVIIARFKAEQCRNRYVKIVSSGESLFSVMKHSLCSMQYTIYQLYCSEKTLCIVIRNYLGSLNILFTLF
jgi:hypothetical protein